ncbi:DUF1598 domain-containing protein [bacterium]|nr:DUF1598 domain-containing protein [bacterium]
MTQSQSARLVVCCRHSFRGLATIVVAIALLLQIHSPAAAQLAGGGGGGQGGGGFGGGGAGGQGGRGGFPGGIAIDANGVVSADFSAAGSARLSKQRAEAFQSKYLNGDINTPSELRKVSLNRLEQACLPFAEKNQPASVDMQYLAGLQRIDFVFLYPQTGDLVIAGPAGSFAPDGAGRMVSVDSGRPVLRLDDLLVSLRTVTSASLIGCSIDPTRENLARFSDYVRRNSTAATPAQIGQRFQEMTAALGLQEVSVFGIAPDSHFAQTLVDADYQMKMLSIGKTRVPVRGFRSHLAMIPVGGNTLQRWWFTPLYEPFQKTPDGNAYAFSGQRVQLMSQEEQVNASGQKSKAAFTRISTQAFAKQFTDKYEEIAVASPVFAELQNLIDLAVLAALIDKEKLDQKVQWNMSLFLDEERAAVARGRVPKTVDSTFNTRKAGRVIIGLVAGGVSIQAHELLNSVPLEESTDRSLTGPASASTPAADLANWWWD